MRLIDADALNLEYEVDMADDWKTAHEIANVVKYAPTVDAVPVIRCKDCEDCTETKLYDGQRWNYCMRLRCVVKDDDFCSWAEKKYPKIKAQLTKGKSDNG